MPTITISPIKKNVTIYIGKLDWISKIIDPQGENGVYADAMLHQHFDEEIEHLKLFVEKDEHIAVSMINVEDWLYYRWCGIITEDREIKIIYKPERNYPNMRDCYVLR